MDDKNIKEKVNAFLSCLFEALITYVATAACIFSIFALVAPAQIQEQTRAYATAYNYVDSSSLIELQKQVENIVNVKKVTLSTKEEELEKLLKYYENGTEYLEIYQGENNPLENTFIIEFKDNTPELIRNAVSSIDSIADIDQVGDNMKLVNKELNTYELLAKLGLSILTVIGLMSIYKIGKSFIIYKKGNIKQLQAFKEQLPVFLFGLLGMTVQVVQYFMGMESRSNNLAQYGLALPPNTYIIPVILLILIFVFATSFEPDTESVETVSIINTYDDDAFI